VARGRARCQESVNAALANGQVSEQGEGEAKDKELTKVLSLTIPQSVLLRADQVIE
jgi:hypothetical protein